MSFTDVWNDAFETAPTNSNYGYEIDDFIRRLQTAVRERMEIDHIWKVGTNDGYHKKLTLYATTKPTAIAGYGIIYTKDVGSGVIEAFFEDALGNEVQLTEGGILKQQIADIIEYDAFVNFFETDYQHYEDFDKLNALQRLGDIADTNTIIYKNAQGQLQFVALGAATTALLSNGVNVAPSFQSPVPADAAISQAKLKTSTGEVSQGDVGALLTLPGGEYGFYPQIKSLTSVATDVSICSGVTPSSYTTVIWLSPASGTVYAKQRYVTSSGEVNWLFFLRDKNTKKIKASWICSDHPCMGNGGNPDVIQHPFVNCNLSKDEIICIVLTNAEIKIIENKALNGNSLLETINKFYEIDNESEGEYPIDEITVGLPEGYNWQAEKTGTNIIPIKKKITKPANILCKKLKEVN